MIAKKGLVFYTDSGEEAREIVRMMADGIEDPETPYWKIFQHGTSGHSICIDEVKEIE